jgi:hypothetical protein
MRSSVMTIVWGALIVARLEVQGVSAAGPNVRPAGDGVMKYEREIEIPHCRSWGPHLNVC